MAATKSKKHSAPVSAAYYSLNTPDSHIALQIVQFGSPTWRQDVEVLKKGGVLPTVPTESANLISAASYRERFDRSLWDKAKAKVDA